MDLGIRGRTAVVTAASRGFGLATAETLAREGVRVAMCARDADTLQEAADRVQTAGEEVHGGAAGRVLARSVDVTEPAALEAFVAETRTRFGPVQMLLVNAGGPPAGTFADLDQEAWDTAWRGTVASAVAACRLVLPDMLEQGWGRMVAVTSVSVHQPVENLMLSSALRPAVQGLVKTLSDEVAGRGVTVNAVAPGFHATSAVDRLIAAKVEQTGCQPEDVVAGWTQTIPAGRLGRPEELAALIAFLMSEQAGYITGQSIIADGGWVRGTFG
ncbi:MAG: SDR family oxidoreductase [bacterium]|nr:SDR family oxidoreductase [bacterium]